MTATPLLICPTCGQWTRNQTAMDAHAQREHGETKPAPSTDKPADYHQKFLADRAARNLARQSNSRFKRGSGVYECADCGKRTRDTGKGEGSVGLCAACYDAAEAANAASDGKE